MEKFNCPKLSLRSCNICVSKAGKTFLFWKRLHSNNINIQIKGLLCIGHVYIDIHFSQNQRSCIGLAKIDFQDLHFTQNHTPLPGKGTTTPTGCVSFPYKVKKLNFDAQCVYISKQTQL